MTPGYLLTPHAPGAFEAYENHSQIRYAAELTNGEGFAAFDEMEASEISELSMIGAVYLEVDPDDDWDGLLRRLGSPRGPKRRVANGLERFALLEANGMPAIELAEAASEYGEVAIVSRDFVPMVLFEGTIHTTLPFRAHWAMSTLQHVDRRKLATV